MSEQGMDRNYRDDSIVYKSPINGGRVVTWPILIGIDLMLDEWGGCANSLIKGGDAASASSLEKRCDAMVTAAAWI